jgi:hypothetical protein
MEGRSMISMYVPDKAKIKEFTKKVEQERRKMEQEMKKETGAVPAEQPQKIQQ